MTDLKTNECCRKCLIRCRCPKPSSTPGHEDKCANSACPCHQTNEKEEWDKDLNDIRSKLSIEDLIRLEQAHEQEIQAAHQAGVMAVYEAVKKEGRWHWHGTMQSLQEWAESLLSKFTRKE